jgi:hypothetical protein
VRAALALASFGAETLQILPKTIEFVFRLLICVFKSAISDMVGAVVDVTFWIVVMNYDLTA